LNRFAQERAERLRAETDRRRPPTPAEIASVDREAKALVRQKHGVDSDTPGWRGLVLAEARKLRVALAERWAQAQVR
jgi:hypothetical protein